MARYVYIGGVRYDESEVDEFMDYDYDPDGSFFDDDEIAATKFDIRRKEKEGHEQDRPQDS